MMTDPSKIPKAIFPSFIPTGPIPHSFPAQDLSQLIQLMKVYISQNESQRQIASSNNQFMDFNVESRNKQVMLPVILLPQSPHWQQQIKLWIANVTKTVFSSAFYYFSKGQMSFEQAKIFCSENILKNLNQLCTKNTVTADHFQIMNNHLVSRVLPYLGTKYPLTESTQINKKLASMVEEIDNIEEMENNYFNSSKICFEYRKDGNYYDIIMKVINDLLERIDSPSDSGKTHYQEFQKFMSDLFNKVYDYEWMTHQTPETNRNLPEPHKKSEHSQSPSKRHQNSHMREHQKQKQDSPLKLERQISFKEEREKEKEERRERRQKREESEKYKVTVREYTSFLIGRKVPENVPLFGEQEISQNKISIKHPAVLRILTKWFEELWKKFEKNYFSNRSERIKLQRGQNVHDLTPEYRTFIDQLLAEEKQKIQSYIQNIEKLNNKLQTNIFRIQQQLFGGLEMDDQERICGKFASKVVKNLHNQIVEYLNKVIHSILICSKSFHEHVLESKRASEVEKSNWPYPPNLISFKVGDLMRCKLSSKEQEILRLFEQILKFHQTKELENKFRIVRIKNRLKGSTNDILINIRFNQLFLCQIQLGIKSHASQFIKASNAFHHYIYELERSRFGPLSELSSIWISSDPRSVIYEKLISEEAKSNFEIKKKGNCNCSQYLVEIEGEESFICDQCNHIRLHSNYILKHQKCQNCRDFYVCSKCRIFKEDFQNLRNKLILSRKTDSTTSVSYRKLLRDNCIKVINSDWQSFEHSPIRYAISIFIEANRIRIKEFKMVNYNNGNYLLGLRDNNEFYEVADISSKVGLREFQAKNVIIQINEHKDILQFEDVKAIKEYILPKMAKQNFKKYKENVVLHLKSNNQKHYLTNFDCRRILMTGNKSQREKIKNIFASDNQLTNIPCSSQDFPNLEWLVLSRNPIQSLEGLEQFRNLKIFVLESRSIEESPRIPQILHKFIKLESLQKIVLTNIEVGQIPKQFSQLKNLKSLFLENCLLTSMENISDCLTLQKLNLSNNHISKIPMNGKNLATLQSLVLHKNPVDLISHEGCLPDLSTSRAMKLAVLDLSQCRIKKVPDNFAALVNLEEFNLQSNQIEELEGNVFKKMAKLKILNLSNNSLKELPDLSCCLKLNKLSISFNWIQELPSYLSKMDMEEFKFEGCPIKRILCVNWLKELLNDNSSILQKYLFWFQKIPAANHTASQSKCAARLLTSDDNEISSEDESQNGEELFPFLLQTSEELLLQEEQGHSSMEEQQSESDKSSVQFSREQSFGSNRVANFFKSIKKRVSLSINEIDEESSSQSEEDNNAIEEQQLESSQAEFQTEDMKFDQLITPEIISKYFSEDDMFVFDFQSKIKYAEDQTIFSKEINLYHDQDNPEIPAKFIAMLEQLSTKCPTLNIYSGHFQNDLKTHLNSRFFRSRLEKEGARVIYDDLRRDRIPFSSAATVKEGVKLQIRNNEPVDIPTYLLRQSLLKLTAYKVKSLCSDFSRCSALKELKIRKSVLPSVPIQLAGLKNLQILDLASNKIQVIDHELWTYFPLLKVAFLRNNKLKEFPLLFSCQQLEMLDISSNDIEDVPQEMNKLQSLKSFHFSHCPVKTINCKQWLCAHVEQDEAIIHDCQLSLRKPHNKLKAKYHSNFSVILQSEMEEEDQEDYTPYYEKQEQNYMGFFYNKFNEKEFLKMFNEKEFLAFRFVFRTKYQQQGITMAPVFKVVIDKWHPDSLLKFQKFLQISGLPTTKIKVTELQFADVPKSPNPTCKFCFESLQHPFYWLKWDYPSPQDWLTWRDQPSFACAKCVEAASSDFQYYKYLKNSVLLPKAKPGDSFKIPINHLGYNLQPQIISNSCCHSFECNGCGRYHFQLGEPRYMCLGCKAGLAEQKAQDLLDLCQSCMSQAVGGGEVMKRLKKYGHRNGHCWLRILFNSQGYYVY